MHLESFTIQNFRKFRDVNNTIYFVNSTAMRKEDSPLNSLIAPSSTLVIGKNNSGKTTIAKALNFICSSKGPKASDFNINYLKASFNKYKKALNDKESFDKLEPPELQFEINIKINFDDHDSDLVNNLHQFIPISISSADLITITVKSQVSETQSFRERIKTILNDDYSPSSECEILRLQLTKFYELLDGSEQNLFKQTYLNSSGNEVKNFSLGKLFNVKEIKANRHLKDNVLSEVYKKIVSSQYMNNENDKEILTNSIKKINVNIDKTIESKSEKISAILKEIEPSNHVQVDLRGNVTEETILGNLIKYNFNDNGDCIPEEQFGLGYINLLNIIGEIIHYIDNYEEKSHQNQINLLFIEEPEAFMHPQMQEFFITRIDNAINKALKNLPYNKSLYCQLIITTHSPHIVNSKIHGSNSFNNINYLTSIDGKASSIKLDDDLVAGNDSKQDKLKTLKFLKKHIKYKVSELFFSDAIIFVEGVTEETLLHYYLEQEEHLRNYYISIFNINGTHSKLYFPLIKKLKIPCLIITDLDIKRDKLEKGDPSTEGAVYKQITSLTDRITTNSTLVNLKGDEKLENIKYFEEDNLYTVFQKDPIESQFATSFEEALILTNYKNPILNSVLDTLKHNIYENIVYSNGDTIDHEELIKNSFKLQLKLSNCKSDFANILLYECITNDSLEKPVLPKYIQDGFNWLQTKLSINSMNNTEVKTDETNS